MRWAGHVARMGGREEVNTGLYIKKNEMGGACSMYGGEERYI